MTHGVYGTASFMFFCKRRSQMRFLFELKPTKRQKKKMCIWSVYKQANKNDSIGHQGRNKSSFFFFLDGRHTKCPRKIDLPPCLRRPAPTRTENAKLLFPSGFCRTKTPGLAYKVPPNVFVTAASQFTSLLPVEKKKKLLSLADRG